MTMIIARMKVSKIIKLEDIIPVILEKFSLIDTFSFRNWVGDIFQQCG